MAITREYLPTVRVRNVLVISCCVVHKPLFAGELTRRTGKWTIRSRAAGCRTDGREESDIRGGNSASLAYPVECSCRGNVRRITNGLYVRPRPRRNPHIQCRFSRDRVSSNGAELPRHCTPGYEARRPLVYGVRRGLRRRGTERACTTGRRAVRQAVA